MSAEVVVAEVENVELPMSVLKLIDADDETSSCGNHSDGVNLSDSDPKDSGIDCSSSDQKVSDVPDEDTANMIMKTVEYYLSDANILKDPFLLKHVRRNKEGYVSLKLLASFRKVRSLSRNWKAVAHSVQKSTLLALNSDCTKVKRLTPLPDYDETITSRSIIVSGFSSDKPSVDSVSEMFALCGDIALVRILRPGGSIPTDVKRFLSKNTDLQSKISALVEFEEHAAVTKAMESVKSSGITIIPVLIKEKATYPESPKKTSRSPSSNDISTGSNSPKESPKKKKKNRKSSNADKKSLEGEREKNTEQKRTRRSSSGSVSSQSSSGYLSSSPSSGSIFDSRYPRRHSFNPSIYNDPKSSFASLSNRHYGSRDRLQRSGAESSGALSPWRRRREQMMQSDSNLVSCTSSTGSLLQSLPVKTIRMPKGPDGTNGFCTRVRPRLPSTAE